MVVTLLISLIILMLSGSSNENCLLSTKTSKLSWVVSIRKKINPDINKIICIGLIIMDDEIVVPSKCLSQKKNLDYYTGTEMKAMTGIEGGSCRQTKDGLNYRSLILNFDGRKLSPNYLLRYVAMLQVQSFAMENGYKPSDALKTRLPDNEQSLRRYVNRSKSRGVSCAVPIFGPDDGKANQVKLEPLRFIEKYECEEALCQQDSKIVQGQNTSCPDLLWSPDTYSCFSFIDSEKTCEEYNMGSPIICENLVCGILKKCEHDGIVIMQLLTVEHLDALSKNGRVVRVPPFNREQTCIF